MIGRLHDLQFGMDGTAVLSIRILNKQDAMDTFNDLRDKDISVEIKKRSKHRSLDANAYCWVLIGKIAEKTGIPKTEYYQRAVREIGGNYTTICAKNEAVQSVCEHWHGNGLGWITDTTESKLDGCTNILLYTGSSAYDTKQMSRLIDYIVSDAKELGIETMTPAELAGLKERWK